MKPNRLYTYFERLVAMALLLGMAAVILLATFSFLRPIGAEVVASGDVLVYSSFQMFFDRLLAAIIAIGLAHSVHQMVTGDRGMAQVKTVVVIGLLAIVRKLVLVDIGSKSGLFLLGIAATILSLGLVFALIHRVEGQRSNGTAIAGPGGRPRPPGKREMMPQPGNIPLVSGVDYPWLTSFCKTSRVAPHYSGRPPFCGFWVRSFCQVSSG
jgi:uncharacterized membrane protein (DUF373 family)